MMKEIGGTYSLKELTPKLTKVYFTMNYSTKPAFRWWDDERNNAKDAFQNACRLKVSSGNSRTGDKREHQYPMKNYKN